jgi:hypothetical protein
MLVRPFVSCVFLFFAVALLGCNSSISRYYGISYIMSNLLRISTSRMVVSESYNVLFNVFAYFFFL